MVWILKDEISKNRFEYYLIKEEKPWPVGNVQIEGFPGTIDTSIVDANCAMRAANITFAGKYLTLSSTTGPVFGIIDTQSAGAITVLTNAAFANNSDIRASGFYFVTWVSLHILIIDFSWSE